MRRREFITLVGGAAATWPLAARAQQPERMRRIGVLWPGAPPDKWDEAFRQGLRALGYVDGRNILLEYRWAEGKQERLPALAQELVRLGVDVIVTISAPAIIAGSGLGREASGADQIRRANDFPRCHAMEWER